MSRPLLDLLSTHHSTCSFPIVGPDYDIKVLVLTTHLLHTIHWPHSVTMLVSIQCTCSWSEICSWNSVLSFAGTCCSITYCWAFLELYLNDSLSSQLSYFSNNAHAPEREPYCPTICLSLSEGSEGAKRNCPFRICVWCLRESCLAEGFLL